MLGVLPRIWLFASGFKKTAECLSAQRSLFLFSASVKQERIGTEPSVIQFTGLGNVRNYPKKPIAKVAWETV